MKNFYTCQMLVLCISCLFTRVNLSAQAGKIISAQSHNSFFELIGNVNIDTGTAILFPTGSDIYYPSNTGSYQTQISNKKFLFKGPAVYPYCFRLGIKRGSSLVYISDYFIVEPKTQKIFCDIDSLRELPILENQSMNELKNRYVNFFNLNHSNCVDSLKKINLEEKDSVANEEYFRNQIQKCDLQILLAYTKLYSNSYVALWNLVQQFKKGYDPILDSIYNEFSVVSLFSN